MHKELVFISVAPRLFTGNHFLKACYLGLTNSVRNINRLALEGGLISTSLCIGFYELVAHQIGDLLGSNSNTRNPQLDCYNRRF